jgi:cell wall-associated NlpC family hydrolase
LFFDALTRAPGGDSMPPWVAAQTVQQSEFADGSNYRGNYQLAVTITAQLLATKTGETTCTTSTTPGQVSVDGVAVRLPAAAGVSGTISAPTATVAKAIAAGLSQLGVTYAWGGGDANGPTLGIHDSGVADAHGDYAKVGFDCAGLMLYAWAQAGLSAPRDSQAQAHQGTAVPYADRRPGDMIGFPGHIAMYLGTFGRTDYMLEAPYSGAVARVAPVRDGHYATVARIWAGTP